MPSTGRRRFLTTAAAVGASLAAAGCSGGGEAGAGESGDGTTTRAGPFGVSDLVFVAEEPTGYEEYEEQPDATYEPDETVWLYYNLENVATEAGEDGEPRMHLTQEITVTGPSGEVVVEGSNEIEQQVPADRAADGLFFYNDVTLPSGSGGGEYELSFELTDEIAGETVSESATFTVDGPKQQITADGQFGVSNGVFAAGEPTGYREYTEQPEATYVVGQTIWYYFEVDGVAASLASGESYETSLTQEFSVTGPDGSAVLDDSYDLGNRIEDPETLDRYWFVNNVRLPSDAATGEYELSFELTDEVGGGTVSHSATFTVEGGVVETDAEFMIDQAVFTSSKATDYGEYEAQPDGTYQPGDPVWVYLDVVGMAYEVVPDGKLVRIEEAITLTGPDDSVLYENTKRYENTFPPDADLSKYYVTDGVTTQSNTPTGSYRLEIELRDLHTDETTSVTGEFALEN